MREYFCLWFVLALVSPAEVGNKSYAGLIVKGQNNARAQTQNNAWAQARKKARAQTQNNAWAQTHSYAEGPGQSGFQPGTSAQAFLTRSS
jgi:hypothetical protein